ncbi:hypothetical protein P280DRAFT_483574 [Massarina eburnea CBS 473.64]|uniref:F-box domain-containing protein n=1 Tax=Massarina eburnea CBS 473.64 TaxID=1395130 RepID=A0A6A6RMU4_9PLEO|nr:hypothetical protein P280DRAFT_483574 [Massarina eburnea CBS 473.64]
MAPQTKGVRKRPPHDDDDISLKPQKVVEGEDDKTNLIEAITKRNQIESPLLRLPAEIRNEIYTYAICNHTIKRMSEKPRHEPSSPGLGLTTIISLPKTCKHLHYETTHLVYKVNIFFFDVNIKYDSYFRNATQIAEMAVESIKFEVKSLAFYNSLTGEQVHWEKKLEGTFNGLRELKRVSIYVPREHRKRGVVSSFEKHGISDIARSL